MRRSVLLRLCPLLLFAILCCSLLARTPPPRESSKPPTAKKVEQLIQDLGNDRFAVREAATRTLLELEEEPPVLRKARKSPDLELRRRLDLILEAHLEKRAYRGLKKGCQLSKEGRFDELIERPVLWQRWNSNEKESKRPVAELAVRLMEWEHRSVGSNVFLVKGSFPGLASFIPSEFRRKGYSQEDAYTPKEFVDMWTASHHCLSDEIKLNYRYVNRYRIFLASGDATLPLVGGGGAIIVAGGNVHLSLGQTSNSIIICDGDLTVSDTLFNCLVIARGKITFNKISRIITCAVFSGESIEEDSIVVRLERGTMLAAKLPDSPIKFFDLAAVGLAVCQFKLDEHKKPDKSQIVDDRQHLDFKSVEITGLRKDSPFASGLRAGDVITAIDEIKTPRLEIFRKVVR